MAIFIDSFTGVIFNADVTEVQKFIAELNQKIKEQHKVKIKDYAEKINDFSGNRLINLWMCLPVFWEVNDEDFETEPKNYQVFSIDGYNRINNDGSKLKFNWDN